MSGGGHRRRPVWAGSCLSSRAEPSGRRRLEGGARPCRGLGSRSAARTVRVEAAGGPARVVGCRPSRSHHGPARAHVPSVAERRAGGAEGSRQGGGRLDAVGYRLPGGGRRGGCGG